MNGTSWRTRWARARERRWVRWGTDALVVLIVLAVVNTVQTRHHLSGVPAPTFTLTTLDGTPVSLTSLEGKPTLLAFWAPWCGVCKAESWNIGLARRLVAEHANVVSLATSFEHTRDVASYVAQQDVTYPVLLAGDDVRDAYQVSVFPTVYFLDAQGVIKHTVVGYTTTLGLLWRLYF